MVLKKKVHSQVGKNVCATGRGPGPGGGRVSCFLFVLSRSFFCATMAKRWTVQF